jgi:hypothetical protein
VSIRRCSFIGGGDVIEWIDWLATATAGANEREARMPKPMKVKVFMDARAGAIEEQINAWLDQIGAAAIIKTETVIAPVAGKAGDGAYPCIVMTIWYEPPSN